ncbi:MAG: alkaline phosphatase family protein [Bacteroidetes bacterium]|nr:alkaline phosphatase family protein [Bacteroidota bacterium]
MAQKTKKPRLLAGPVVGAVTKTSAKIWIAYQGEGKNALILGDTAEKRIYYPTKAEYITNSEGVVALTMTFTGLQPDHHYNILISIDGWGAHAKYVFKTPADSIGKDFNFLVGSCVLLNTDVSRGIFPGLSNWIFYRMKKKHSDCVLWLGNTSYYFYPWQHSSYEAMFKRQLKIRKVYNNFYRDLLAGQANYTIWDDRDYGPDNSDNTFALKDTSLKIFKGFWPNEYPEGTQFNGNYYNFRRYDTEFFMLDDRYFRDPPGDSSAAFLGETQMIWLKHKLLSSQATLKWICTGSQVLNDDASDSYARYSKERNDLFDFIVDNNITGVVFLSGGQHSAEICKREWNGYPIYEFTSAPLTTLPLPWRMIKAYHNPWRIKGTDFPFRNFGRISVSGPAEERMIKMEFLGRAGKTRKEFHLSEKELQKK